MKKKICIGVGVALIILIVAGIVTSYADSGRVTTGHEPKYCIKVVSDDGNKVTYWGLGYKVICYVGVSPKEPYESNIGVKMGSWFMKYDLPKSNVIEIEYEGQTITINDIKDIGTIENILVQSKYNNEICNGINTYKITLNNDIYYIKESCKEIQKGDKQATISTEDLETINNIISNKVNNNQKQDDKKSFSYEELSNMALEYFLKNGDDVFLPKEEYHVGIDNKVIPKYQNQDMIVIEIRHINNNINNTLDARYYINIYTAKGFDDLENEIDLN